MFQSKRINKMECSPIRKLAEFEAIAKKKGVEVIHLNIGQPDVATPVSMLDAVRKFDGTVLKYADSRGLPSTVDTFIKYYSKIGIDFEARDMVVTNGGSEALLFAFIATCDIGDEIIVPAPYYSNYNSFADIANVKFNPVLSTLEEDYKLPSAADLEKAITDKTKAILFSNPCNPTGAVYTHEELMEVLNLAKKHDLYVISDEVYREYVYDGLKPMSIYDLNYETDRIILIDSLSKRYSACGARVGIIASKNRELMDNVLKLGQSRLSIPTLEQVMASSILEVPEEYIVETQKLYERRRNAVIDALSKVEGVKCSNPRGAFYIMVRLPVKDSDHFAKWILSDFDYEGKTVMVAPAAKFYGIEDYGLNEVRLSYCLDEAVLVNAVNILEKALIEYKKIYE
ncbi:MAG: pyridoxal phosphate-dependent aminotransferase [Clostridium sp.]|uniref:pyridoxal phosphate-dependent aminotransferase n=1 Tax=Clostridium culturomicium TaxID=1499683 RepID=UPI000B2A71E3|nr:pyridoxal phosphate-dependent aminotransferase [Clostridium culturomicium]MDU4892276.1 pyridoxal phosphate-dependent aminotransferase [Clostridium sp.]MDU7084393.1 pyridoxal phosphate-dependent aminotransferase [Clostridium sp.]